MPPALPSRIGRYEVLGLLGHGGMGAVYRARDPELDRVVAVKTINPFLLGTDDLRREYIERFRREARAAGRLSHPNVVSVYDLGLDEATGAPFIVMEYVAGVTLEAVLEEAVLPPDQAIEILEQVAAALDEAHRGGVVHRDVKPANVYLDERGRVKVGDFGVARLEGSELTHAGVALGTPGYLAPEVVHGGVADARADVFALGVLAYRVLTGERPFRGPTPEATTFAVVEGHPAPPRAVRPDVPEHASAAVMHALAKSPEERTPTAEAFVRELTGRSTGPRAAPVTPTAVPATAVPPPTVALERPTVAVAARAWFRRRPRLALLAVAAGLAALAAAAALLTQAPGRRDTTRPAPPPSTVTATPRRRPPSPIRTVAAPPVVESEPAPDDPGRDAADEIAREARKKAEEIGRDAQKKLEDQVRKLGQKKKGHGKGGKPKDR